MVYPDAGGVLSVADLDLDSDLDLLLITGAETLTVRLNDGNAGFGVSQTMFVDVGIEAIQPADFDGNADVDLCVLRRNQRAVTMLWGNADGGLGVTIEPIEDECSTDNTCHVHAGVLADIDNDDDLDILAVNAFPGAFSVAENDGRGKMTLRPPRPYGSTEPRALAVGHMNRSDDDFLDAVIVDSSDGSLYVVLGTGGGLFGLHGIYSIGARPGDVQLADLDLDGDLDTASVSGKDGTMSVLFNRGDGTLTGRTDYNTGASPTGLAAEDLTGDGFPDIAVANWASTFISVFINQGDGGLAPPVEYAFSGLAFDIGAADLNRDGHLDLFTSSPNTGNCTVFLNQGSDNTGTFGQPRNYPPAAQRVAAADFDADGHLDLITGTAILLGNGDGSFEPATTYNTGTSVRYTLPGDLDGDGDVDLVAVNFPSPRFTVISNQSLVSDVEFLQSICTVEDFFDVSAAHPDNNRTQRFLKYITPAGDTPDLLPTTFQNTRRYDLHQEFMSTVFKDHFPGLTTDEYVRLVSERATRKYYVGAISLFVNAARPVYGFTVFARFSDPTEALTAEEVKSLYDQLRETFQLEPLVYAPTLISRAAVNVAESWGDDPGFPVLIDEAQSSDSCYESYTRAVGYGPVRVLDEEEFEAANANGRLTFRDIVVLERAPRDIEAVVAGVITAEPQGAFSHVSVRTARRGTPNAFACDAIEAFEPLEGQIVRLEVQSSGFVVDDTATLEDAETWWIANRPGISRLPNIDEQHTELTSLAEIAAANPLDETLEARFGGKGTNLGILQKILTGEFAPYQERGFVIPVHYYLKFMRSNFTHSLEGSRLVSYEEYIEDVMTHPVFEIDSERRFAILAEFQKRMREEGRLPEGLEESILARIEEVFGSTDDMVRTRSSSNTEDILEFNGAGLYDSTGLCGADDLDHEVFGPSMCDPQNERERPTARALKKVWASLWNFRAYEERAYYGIPQNLAAMAVLVTRAFRNEKVNGVAFTGNPSNSLDLRYVVVSQVDEISVVSPDPGVQAAKDILEMENGQVARIIRATSSSLLPPGVQVLSDDDLRELGALLAHIDRSFPIDPGDHDRDDVLLDIEFKKEPDGSLAVKQVRPFLLATEPPLIFELAIPEETVVCGVFQERRSPRQEYEFKSTLRFKAGSVPLPATQDTFSWDLIEEIRFGPGQEVAVPVNEGLFSRQRFQNSAGTSLKVDYHFTYEQEFGLANGDCLLVNLSLLNFTTIDGGAVERTLTLDEQYLTDELFLRATLMRGDTELADIHYSSCSYELLPTWEIEAVLVDGSRVVLEERYRSESVADVGPASLTYALVELGGELREEADYWNLIYAADRHNLFVRHWVVLDRPLRAPGIEPLVHAVELINSEVVGGLDPVVEQVNLLGENFEVLAAREVESYGRELVQRPSHRFRRGDVNSDGDVDASDSVALLVYLFAEGSAPECKKAADVDDGGGLNMTDALRILLHVFSGRGPLAVPFSACGTDRTPDTLTCESFTPCRSGR
jgi:hypothetical protein